MIKMKKAFLAFMILMLTTASYAASIEAPETMPEKTVWSFSITLPNGQDFDNATLQLDGSNLIEFYTNPSDEIIAYNENSEKLFSNTEPVGNKIHFLVSPQTKGDHVLKLEIDGETSGEKTVNFFELYDAEGKADLQTQVSSLRGSVNSIIEQFNEINDRIDQKLTQEDKQTLQTNINNVNSSLTELETKLEQQTEENNETAPAP